jgi:hypothetical protein
MRDKFVFHSHRWAHDKLNSFWVWIPMLLLYSRSSEQCSIPWYELCIILLCQVVRNISLSNVAFRARALKMSSVLLESWNRTTLVDFRLLRFKIYCAEIWTYVCTSCSRWIVSQAIATERERRWQHSITSLEHERRGSGNLFDFMSNSNKVPSRVLYVFLIIHTYMGQYLVVRAGPEERTSG